MIDEAIKGISETKISASGVLLASSGSAMTYGTLMVSYQDLVLGFAGFLLSVFSYYYEYSHSTEEKSKHQIVSEMIKHLVFGTFAFPAMYSFMLLKFDFSFSINIFISVVTSYSVMKFVSVGVSGSLSLLRVWLGGNK